MDIRPPERAVTEPSRVKSRRGTVLRLAGWGSAAAFALATLAIVTQSPMGNERIKFAIAALEAPAVPAAIAKVGTVPSDLAIKSLEARIAQLTGDRDRLATRVAALENGFEDLTGSIRTPPAASQPPGTAPTVALPMVERTMPPMVVAVAPPLINPLATPPAGVASILPEPQAEPAAPHVAPETPAREASTPEPQTEPVPLPPERVAAIAPSEPVKAEPTKPAVPTRARAEFGIELATEPTVDNLRRRWASVKANYGPLLVGLSPVAVRDRHPGSTAVRLVAGPLPSLIAARQLCARFAAQSGDCWPTRINPADVIQR